MIDLSHLKGRRYGVFGLGRTGLAAVKALVAGGVKVVAWDDAEPLRAAAAAASPAPQRKKAGALGGRPFA